MPIKDLVERKQYFDKYNREYYLKHKEQENKRCLEYQRAHPDYHRLKEKEYYDRAKTDTLTHYGFGKLVCVRCGFSDIRALTIDHINSGGSRDRKAGKIPGGGLFYAWLRRKGYPEGYMTLCMNCQFIKAKENNEYGIIERAIPTILV